MTFPARTLPLLLGLALTGGAVLAAQQGQAEIRNPNPASAPAVPASDATAPAAQMKDAGKAADAYVHENPWKAVGIAAGAGLIIGMLISRR